MNQFLNESRFESQNFTIKSISQKRSNEQNNFNEKGRIFLRSLPVEKSWKPHHIDIFFIRNTGLIKKSNEKMGKTYVPAEADPPQSRQSSGRAPESRWASDRRESPARPAPSPSQSAWPPRWSACPGTCIRRRGAPCSPWPRQTGPFSRPRYRWSSTWSAENAKKPTLHYTVQK